MATASNITDGVPANCPGSRVLFQGLGQFEKAVCACTASMDDALGNSLVVEMSDFFAQDEIFQQRRTARIGSSGSSDCRKSASPDSSSTLADRRWPSGATLRRCRLKRLLLLARTLPVCP